MLVRKRQRHLERIGEGDHADASARKQMQIGDACTLGAEQLHALALKQTVIDLCRVDPALQQCGGAQMRFGGDVGIAEAARVRADGGVKRRAKLLRDRDPALVGQLSAKVKQDLARGRRLGGDVMIRKDRARAVMIDRKIDPLAVKLPKRAQLRGGGRVHADHAVNVKPLGDRRGKHARLLAIHQEAQALGHLALANAEGARAKLAKHARKRKGRANGVGVGITVKQDQRVGRLLQIGKDLLKGPRAIVSHTPSPSSPSFSSGSSEISSVSRIEAMCAP